jgi:sigma-B regulation protein RsbU (phosphoserine phosphatase)
MSGYEVCQRLKSDPWTEKIPVLFVTALHEASDEERGLELGALDFISKPFLPALVRARVRNQLELKRYRDFLEGEVQRRTEELLASNLARLKMEQELDLARQLQRSMLPADTLELPGPAGGSLAALLRPARAVGGDLYDYRVVGPGKVLLVLGDVSDKGVAAALFMVRVLTQVRSLAGSVPDPGEVLRQVNQALCRENDACMFVTLACCLVDLGRMEWAWSSGGHEPPLLLERGQAHFLDLEGGPALGLVEDAQYPVHRGPLSPGATLVLYTDGVTEAEDGSGDRFGADRLLRTVAALDRAPLADLLGGISSAIRDFVQSHEQSDDLAMLAVRAPGRTA